MSLIRCIYVNGGRCNMFSPLAITNLAILAIDTYMDIMFCLFIHVGVCTKE